MKRIRAVYELDRDDKAWLVHTPAIPICHTYGRTLEQARERIREALLLFRERGTFEVVDDIRLPGALRRKVARARAARQRAELRQAEARQVVAETTASLKRAGLSLRDAGDLLGLSRQRIAQIGRSKATR
ncbi:MAG: type II toxin-antitoxin system HicB family antitoxin [Chloroflexi bacterium]|nr:type II toxin-antitoxin system HicB family antitoxin [Chloroflexota bacterium]